MCPKIQLPLGGDYYFFVKFFVTSSQYRRMISQMNKKVINHTILLIKIFCYFTCNCNQDNIKFLKFQFLREFLFLGAKKFNQNNLRLFVSIRIE